jgi:hypothetical protein
MFKKITDLLKRNKEKKILERDADIKKNKTEWEQFDLKNKKFPKWFQYVSLYILALVVYLMINNLISAFTTKKAPFIQKEETVNKQALLGVKKKLDNSRSTNFRDLKRKAMDSLVDNKILTVKNIRVIDSMYPDSLCDCY